MRDLLKSHPEMLKTSIGAATHNLLEGYKNYENQLASDSWSSTQQSRDTAGWKQFLYGEVQKSPDLTNVVTGLFLSLPQSTTAPVNISNSATPGAFTAKSWNKP